MFARKEEDTYVGHTERSSRDGERPALRRAFAESLDDFKASRAERRDESTEDTHDHREEDADADHGRGELKTEDDFGAGLKVRRGDRHTLHPACAKDTEQARAESEQRGFQQKLCTMAARVNWMVRNVAISVVRWATEVDMVIVAPSTAPILKTVVKKRPVMRMSRTIVAAFPSHNSVSRLTPRLNRGSFSNRAFHVSHAAGFVRRNVTDENAVR